MKRLKFFIIFILSITFVLALGACSNSVTETSSISSVSNSSSIENTNESSLGTSMQSSNVSSGNSTSTNISQTASNSSIDLNRKYEIEVATNNIGGNVKVSAVTAQYGEDVSLTATAEDGYEFVEFIVMQGETKIDVVNGKFTMPAGAVSISGVFAKLYNITVIDSDGGSISVSKTKAKEGDIIALSNSVEEGYEFIAYSVKQGTKPVSVSKTDWTFTMPAGDVTVKATFTANTYNIVISNVEGGSVKASKGTAKVGEEITLTNTPLEGYKFASYRVTKGTTNVIVTDGKFKMPAGNVTISADFTKADYIINIQQVEGGMIIAKTSANHGEEISLSNEVSLGYKFVSYIVKQGETPIQVINDKFTMPAGDVTVTATYEKIAYSITVTQVEGGSVSISKIKANYKDEITLSNIANEGYKFGRYIVKQGTQEIVVTNGKFKMPAGNVTVTAEFTKSDFVITIVQVEGGTISVNKVGANYGEEIQLSNTVKTGYSFGSYKVMQGNTPISVLAGDKFIMPAGDVTVTGTFEKISYMIEIIQVEGGTISVKGNATYGEEVTITSTPNSGYGLDGYVVKQGSTSITVTNGKFTMPAGKVTVTASFTRQTYNVTIKVNNSDYGTVSKSSVSVASGTSISANGATLTIGNNTITASATTQSAQYSYAFKDWTNASGTVTKDITITANFTRTTRSYVVTIAVNTSGYGTVSKSSVSVEYGTSISASGATLTIGGNTITASATTQSAQYSYAFKDWTNASGTVTGAKTITANFTRSTRSYTVTIAVNTSGYGTVSKSSVSVAYGTSISASGATLTIGSNSITASATAQTAQYSYAFSSWTGASGTVTAAKTITANFTRSTRNYTVTISVNTSGYGTVSKSSVSVAYGTSISSSGATLTIGSNSITASATAQTAQYSYAFSSWTGASGTVTAAKTITANFTRTTRS